MTREIDIGAIFERVFTYYRDNASVLLPVALIIFLVPALIQGAVATGSVGLGTILLSSIVALVASYWYAGMVVELVSDVQDGRRDQSVGELFAAVAPVVVPLIGASFLAAIATGLGLVLFIIPGLFVLTYLAVLAPVVVIERPGVIPAFSRSFQLVSGNALRVFGVIVAMFVIQFILQAIIGGIFRGIGDNFATIALGSLIANTVAAPLTALAAGVLYFALLDAHGAGGPDTVDQPGGRTQPIGSSEGPGGSGAQASASPAHDPSQTADPAADPSTGTAGSGESEPGEPRR
ncbi:MAG: YciC family protein [Solirubrobacterales bacterium]